MASLKPLKSVTLEVKVVNEVEVASILLRRAGRVKLVFKGVSWSQVHPADFQGMLLDT